MSEEPTSASSPSSSDAEWTDESGYLESETPSVPDTTEATDNDEWPTDDSLNWEEEYSVASPPPPEATTAKEALAWLRPLGRRLAASWRRLVAGIRTKIPAAASLSDTAISGILIGILVVILLVLYSVRQPSVATEPATGVTLSEPSDAETMPVTSSPTDTPTAPTNSLEAAPPPMTDRVNSDRIAQIQTQLTDSNIPHANRVIDSVRADLTNNRLTLVFNGDWFRLSDYEQVELANQLQQQSTELSFEDLQFLTTEEDLIARSPVIGNGMVILLREKPTEVEPPPRPRYRITVDR